MKLLFETRRHALYAVLLAAGAVSGCGQRGPLYLPTPAPAAKAAPPAIVEPAQPAPSIVPNSPPLNVPSGPAQAPIADPKTTPAPK